MTDTASTPFSDGTYTPDPLAQFLSRVVPWSKASPPDSYVNIHAFGGKIATPYRGGGRAYGSMGEYGEIANFVRWLNRIEAEVFFCLSGQVECGEYKGRYRKAIRTRANARWLKSFVLDLDVKPTGYASQRDALAALLQFSDDLGLQPSMIVNTGHGIHSYWTLEEAIPLKTWQPLADKMVAAAQKGGLKCDTSVTRNPATLLRLPTSFNRKDPTPLACGVLQ